MSIRKTKVNTLALLTCIIIKYCITNLYFQTHLEILIMIPVTVPMQDNATATGIILPIKLNELSANSCKKTQIKRFNNINTDFYLLGLHEIVNYMNSYREVTRKSCSKRTRKQPSIIASRPIRICYRSVNFLKGLFYITTL